MLKKPPSEINTDDDAFLIEFYTPSGAICAVCPVYVVGVDESPNGVAIRTARGSVADQFFVRAPVREVIDRLRAGWHRAKDSFLAHYMRADLGAMEDRLAERIRQQLAVEVQRVGDDVKGALPKLVEGQIKKLASADSEDAENKSRRRTA